MERPSAGTIAERYLVALRAAQERRERRAPAGLVIGVMAEATLPIELALYLSARVRTHGAACLHVNTTYRTAPVHRETRAPLTPDSPAREVRRHITRSTSERMAELKHLGLETPDPVGVYRKVVEVAREEYEYTLVELPTWHDPTVEALKEHLDTVIAAPGAEAGRLPPKVQVLHLDHEDRIVARTAPRTAGRRSTRWQPPRADGSPRPELRLEKILETAGVPRAHLEWQGEPRPPAGGKDEPDGEEWYVWCTLPVRERGRTLRPDLHAALHAGVPYLQLTDTTEIAEYLYTQMGEEPEKVCDVLTTLLREYTLDQGALRTPTELLELLELAHLTAAH